MNCIDIDERESFKYSCVLLGDDGQPPPLTALRLTLYDVATGEILNAREDQDVLNANGVTYAPATGELVWASEAVDAAIITPRAPTEKHVALFVAHWGAASEKPWEVTMTVRNLRKHPP